jgi:hypothetical protein
LCLYAAGSAYCVTVRGFWIARCLCCDVQALRLSAVRDLRDLSAVLLRRVFVEESTVWDRTSADGRRALKLCLLEAVEAETDRSIRRHVCDTIADLAIGTLTNDEPWPEMFLKLNAWVQSPNYDLREAAFYSFEMLSAYFAVVRVPATTLCEAAAV